MWREGKIGGSRKGEDGRRRVDWSCESLWG